jgi:hypothetical protein
MAEKLKIGLLLDSFELRKWEYVLLERLINSSYATIDFIILNNSRKPPKSLWRRVRDNWQYAAYLLYSKIDARLFNVHPNAFEKIDATALLADTPRLETIPISAQFSDRFPKEDIGAVKGRDLDILLRMGFRILRGEILQSARYGVWSYHHGDNKRNRGGPAGFWEVMEQWETTGSILQILTEDLDGGTVLYRSYAQTDKRSVHRNRNSFYWKSLSFLPRMIEELHRTGSEAFFGRIAKLNPDPDFYSKPIYSVRSSNLKVLKLAFALYVRFLKDRVISMFYLEQWYLMYAIGKGRANAFWRFKEIIPPRDRFYADPCIIKGDEQYYIFIEEFMYQSDKGHISVITMDEKGNYGQPVRVIDVAHHLAYPHVFKSGEDYYLIPDSRSRRTIELYRCIEFPCKWEFQMDLIEDVDAVDTTMFFHNNRWWLFTNLVENSGASSYDELFLFHSDTLTTQSWTPHPMNPIVSDVRRARPGGSIYCCEGKIIRPSQNCSRRYGYGLTINEIKTLSTTNYEEIVIDSITPDWDPKLMATHTIAGEERLSMIDGLMRRRRF